MAVARTILLYISLAIISAIAFYSGQFSSRIIATADALLFALIHFNFLKVAILTVPRDLKGIIILFKVQYALRRNIRRNSTISKIFDEYVSKYGNGKDAFVDAETGKHWTFDDVQELSNRVANFFALQGYRKGDVVALYMSNSPEYACMWLGLSKLGVVAALINYNLRAEPLGHSVNVSNAKSIIVGGDLLSNLVEAIHSHQLTNAHLPIYVYDTKEKLNLPENGVSITNFAQQLTQCRKSAPEVEDGAGFKDVLFYIYTSGTTGLPKAAIITHARFVMMASGTHCCFNMRGDDRIYITMPLYHSAAGILGVGQTLLHGATCVIRKKFSASRFWEDCIQFNCTASQYIGELCRYLLAQPPKETDRKHKVRLMYGNGLRQQIWKQFMDRFGVRRIGEFYGSTEGNASLLNIDNHIGACGFLPIYPILRPVYPVCLMRVDQESGELIRNSKGLCVPCRPGENGEIVGRIVKGDPVKDFVGYVSGKETNKKVIRNVFRHGDAAFSSGDILYMDEGGYLYFRDRTGDTFRWKGENVSTTEVESVLHKAIAMNDATVYGVEVPNMEGKAGMAAIADENENVDVNHLQIVLKEKLPAYARPVFLRLCQKVDTTGTFKLKKTDLQKAGFDPDRVNGDRLFYLNSQNGQYEQLTHQVYQSIMKGTVSF